MMRRSTPFAYGVEMDGGGGGSIGGGIVFPFPLPPIGFPMSDAYQVPRATGTIHERGRNDQISGHKHEHKGTRAHNIGRSTQWAQVICWGDDQLRKFPNQEVE